MKMMTKPFNGSNVFLSRNLVPPEIYPAVHDALKLNGAQLFLCCDPSRSGPNDYHVISDPQHEKFDDLKAKGCKLLGPHCVLSCAKENRSLPTQQGFTCCLAMDGVKVLASGFEKDEKVNIEELVTAMGGVIQNRSSMEVSFVVVKNVLAAKYKWALTILKKPIVTVSWIYQCWKEHRVVPQEPYRVLPFSGLTICVTRVQPDMRKEMKNNIVQNGGKYSADLTRNCTHLISDAPEGDKYRVARTWGHIHIVTPKWLDQSIARRVCLDEDSFSVQVSSTSSAGVIKGGMVGGPMKQHSQMGKTYSECDQSSMIAESETITSQNMSSTFSDSTIFTIDNDSEAANLQPGDQMQFDGLVADDSQTEDNDFYLSDCRILFVGFEASEMRKLVNLVRKGGGSRCMSFAEEKLTHIVVGAPSENERKEIRHHAALGIIYIVKVIWLEECDHEKKEIPVSQRHLSDLLAPRVATGISKINQGKYSTDASAFPACQVKPEMTSETSFPCENDRERTLTTNLEGAKFSEEVQSGRLEHFALNDGCKDLNKLHSASVTTDGQKSLSNIFKGKVFRFSKSFPEDLRPEIVDWINQGGGLIVDDQSLQKVQFTIESHGSRHKSSDVSGMTIVSSHWIRFCLEGGYMPDVGSHIIYSPLPCQVPFPGFEGFRFCISQYDNKDRLLLRNLCFVLGAKFTEKLTKRVTHLLCKFCSGPKYESACKWGMQPVTSDWIIECVRQDKIVPLGSFRPKNVTAQDQEAGLCTMTQYPTQAARMVFEDGPSQIESQSQVVEKVSSITRRSNPCKRGRLTEGDNPTDIPSAKFLDEVPTGKGSTSGVAAISDAVPKSEIACKQGIQSDTSEFVSECTRQDAIVVMDSVGTKDVRAQDRHARKRTRRHSPTQTAQVASGDGPSQFQFQPQLTGNKSSYGSSSINSKWVRLTDNANQTDLLPTELREEVPTGQMSFTKNSTSDDIGEVCHAVPDVAAAIEDLLAQSNKIQDMSTPVMNGSDQSLFSPDCSILGQHHVDPQPVFGISKHWLSRTEKQDDHCNLSGSEVKQSPYDGFSETQTDSQVVVYEDDLSGRQRIIERVQTRSSLS